MQLDREKRTQPLNIESSSLMLVEGPQNEEHVSSLLEPLQIIRRRIWIITLSAVLFVGVAIGFSLLQTPVYEAKIKILVGLKGDDGTAAAYPHHGRGGRHSSSSRGRH